MALLAFLIAALMAFVSAVDWHEFDVMWVLFALAVGLALTQWAPAWPPSLRRRPPQ